MTVRTYCPVVVNDPLRNSLVLTMIILTKLKRVSASPLFLIITMDSVLRILSKIL